MSAPNRDQREAWNGDSGHRWAADADRRDRILAPVADALLTAASLRTGEAVLDVGCGCGVTTLAAADAVAPAEVVGIDLSEPMLDLARQRAGDRNAVFVQADAQTHPFRSGQFDVAISRFGTMFFDDPVAAFTNIVTAMRPGGRLCLATWQPLAANDWLLVPGTALLQYGSLPETDNTAPGMFAQSDPEAIHRVLSDAGWHHVAVTPVSLELRLGSNAAEAVDYLADTSIARAVLETIDPAHRDEAIATVTDALAAHVRVDGVKLHAGIYLVTATKM
ncbi:MAG TPA: methyltransferase domain-containing protein [Microthrixaceae bacterium]|nr:methyltransferase domain-containing protein [Microthrixaceae bacterium]